MSNEKSKSTFIASVFYIFLVMTVIAFLFRLFGLNWFAANVNISEPNKWVQIAVKAFLKAFELFFIYMILTQKKWYLCLFLAVLHTSSVGFIPAGVWQSVADFCLMLIFCLLLHKKPLYALIDFFALYILMTLYGLIVTYAKFGIASNNTMYSFYYSAMGIIDYKLFIVTLFLFIKYKGGIKLWRIKRKLFSR